MTKTELIDKIADKTGLTKKDCGKVADSFFNAITKALAEGKKIQLVGFGSFEVRTREARKGRNPQTGTEIEIAAANVPVFKAGKVLKDAVGK